MNNNNILSIIDYKWIKGGINKAIKNNNINFLYF